MGEAMTELRLCSNGEVAPRRDWTAIGRVFTEDAEAKISAAIDALEWAPVADRFAFSQGYAIEAAIQRLKIPNVGLVAAYGTVELYADGAPVLGGFYGIEGDYANARIRLYVLDLGTKLVPLAVDVWPR